MSGFGPKSELGQGEFYCLNSFLSTVFDCLNIWEWGRHEEHVWWKRVPSRCG